MKELHVKSKTFNQKDTLILDEEIETELEVLELITTSDFNITPADVNISSELYNKLLNATPNTVFKFSTGPAESVGKFSTILFLSYDKTYSGKLVYFSTQHLGRLYQVTVDESKPNKITISKTDQLNAKLYRHELWLGSSSTYSGEQGQIFIYSKQNAEDFFGKQVGVTFSLSGIGLDWCEKIINNAVTRKIRHGGTVLASDIYWSIGGSNFHRALYELDTNTGLVSKTETTLTHARIVSSIEV